MTGDWYWCSTPAATGAIVVDGPTITATAPYWRRYRGKPITLLARHVRSKGGTFTRLPEEILKAAANDVVRGARV